MVVKAKIMVFSTLFRNEKKNSFNGLMNFFAEFSFQFFVFKARPKIAVKIKVKTTLISYSNFGKKKDLF